MKKYTKIIILFVSLFGIGMLFNSGSAYAATVTWDGGRRRWPAPGAECIADRGRGLWAVSDPAALYRQPRGDEGVQGRATASATRGSRSAQ